MFSNKALKSLLIPLIIEQFLAISLGIADTMMVSTVGESAVSGVSLVDMLNVLIIDIFAGLASGGAVVASQFIGAKNRRGSERSSGQLILIAAISGIAVSAAVLLLRRPLLRLLFRSVEDEVMASALTYFTVTALSFPFISVYNAAAALFRSMGNSRISMISSLVINIINIIGNSIFIFGFGMGVAGAALSTLLSRFCAMAFLLVRLSVKDSELRLRLRNMIPDLSVIRKILYIGLPSCFENSLFQLGRILGLRHRADRGKCDSEQSRFLRMHPRKGTSACRDHRRRSVRGSTDEGRSVFLRKEADEDRIRADRGCKHTCYGDASAHRSDLQRLRRGAAPCDHTRAYPYRICDNSLAFGFCNAECASRGRRREIHSRSLGVLDGYVPHSVQLYFRLGILPRRDRRVVRHGNGLGVPCIYVRRTVSLRKMDRRKPCKMSIDKADFTMLQ